MKIKRTPQKNQKNKILIIGDSFSSEQLSKKVGWIFKLKEFFEIVNLSSPGIGEYKILEKLKTIELNQFDKILISHTSPYRINVSKNILYDKNHLYHNSDIIIEDLQNKSTINDEYFSIYKFIIETTDENYLKFVHTQCVKEILEITKNYKTIHITHFEWDDLFPIENMHNFYSLWVNHKGNINHYSEKGNEILLSKILHIINKY
jgi:hypothetical protein